MDTTQSNLELRIKDLEVAAASSKHTIAALREEVSAAAAREKQLLGVVAATSKASVSLQSSNSYHQRSVSGSSLQSAGIRTLIDHYEVLMRHQQLQALENNPSSKTSASHSGDKEEGSQHDEEETNTLLREENERLQGENAQLRRELELMTTAWQSLAQKLSADQPATTTPTTADVSEKQEPRVEVPENESPSQAGSPVLAPEHEKTCRDPAPTWLAQQRSAVLGPIL